MVSCSGAPVSVHPLWNHQRPGSRPSAISPSSAAKRWRPVRRGPRVCAATWRSPLVPRPAPRTGRAGSAPRDAVLVDEPTRRPTRRRRLLAVNTTRVLARPTTMRNSRRSSSRRARLRSDCEIGRSSAARSNIGSGRDKLGKFPSTVPATMTVSSSVPTAPCAVNTRTASDDAGSVPRYPGPCSPASSARTNASVEGSGDSPASAITPERPTTTSISRRAPDERSAAATSLAEYGRSCQRIRNASSTERSETIVA